MQGECPSIRTSRWETILDSGRHLAALDEVEIGCANSVSLKMDEMTRSSIEASTEEEDYARLRTRADSTRQRAAEAVAGTYADTMVEAELLYFLAKQQARGDANSVLAARNMAKYAEDPSFSRLANTYLQIGAAAAIANLTLQFLHEFDWDAAQGCPPDIGDMAARARNVYEEALALARSKAPADDAQWVNTMYGNLVKTTGPLLEKAEAAGDTAVLAGVATATSWDLGYWQNYNASPLPTQQEAEYLAAVYRSQTRTLVTEWILLDLLVATRDPMSVWEEQRPIATLMLALPSMESSFTAYICK